MILGRLCNTITKNDRKNIKKELYEIEHKKNLLDIETEKDSVNLVEFVKKLNKKEKYRYHDHDNLNHHGIRDIENCLIMIMIMIITNQYLSKVLSKKIINIMKAKVIKTKNYQ